MFDILKLQAELALRKDEFWARKIVYLAGIKAAAHMSLLKAGDVVPKSSTDLLFSLIAKNAMDDFKEHYPNTDRGELTHEVVKDTEELLETLLNEAMKDIDD